MKNMTPSKQNTADLQLTSLSYPDTPYQVDINHMQDNGCLLDDEQITFLNYLQTIIAFSSNNPDWTPYQTTLKINSHLEIYNNKNNSNVKPIPFDVAFVGDNIYAIYKALGKGGFGKGYLAQEIISKDWQFLKKTRFSVSNKDLSEKDVEFENLIKLRLTHANTDTAYQKSLDDYALRYIQLNLENPQPDEAMKGKLHRLSTKLVRLYFDYLSQKNTYYSEAFKIDCVVLYLTQLKRLSVAKLNSSKLYTELTELKADLPQAYILKQYSQPTVEEFRLVRNTIFNASKPAKFLKKLIPMDLAQSTTLCQVSDLSKAYFFNKANPVNKVKFNHPEFHKPYFTEKSKLANKEKSVHLKEGPSSEQSDLLINDKYPILEQGFSTTQILQVVESILAKTRAYYHEEGAIHSDYNPANIIIDLNTWYLDPKTQRRRIPPTIIDVAQTTFLKPNQTSAIKEEFYMSAGMTAPELLSLYKKHKNASDRAYHHNVSTLIERPQFIYTEKTDVYAVGKSLIQALNCAAEREPFDILDHNCIYLKPKADFKEHEKPIREPYFSQLHDLLAKMIAEDPNQRIGFNEALAAIETIVNESVYNELIEESLVKPVGILHASELFKANGEINADLLKAAKKTKGIIVFDPQRNFVTSKKYNINQIKRHFTQEGVPILDIVGFNATPQGPANTINVNDHAAAFLKIANQAFPNSAPVCFEFTKQKQRPVSKHESHPSTVKTSIIPCIHVKKGQSDINYETIIKDSLKEMPVTEKHFKTIVANLAKAMKETKQAMINASSFTKKSLNKRQQILKNKSQAILDAYSAKTLTYANVNQILFGLEEQTRYTHTKLLPYVLSYLWAPDTNTTKSIRHMRHEIMESEEARKSWQKTM